MAHLILPKGGIKKDITPKRIERRFIELFIVPDKLPLRKGEIEGEFRVIVTQSKRKEGS